MKTMNANKVVKLLLACCVWVAGVSLSGSAQAQEKELGVFNSLSVGLGVGTTGIGIDLAAPISPYVAVRAGVQIMPGFKVDDTGSVEASSASGSWPTSYDIQLQGSAKRTTGEVVFNFYPAPNASSFFVAAGLSFGGSEIVSINGHSETIKNEMASAAEQGREYNLEIGDFLVPVNRNGDVSGGLKTKSVRPYLGVGFGRAVPKKRIGLMFEAGVQFHGKPSVFSDYGSVKEALVSPVLKDTYNDIVKKLTIYPVVRLRLCGRLF